MAHPGFKFKTDVDEGGTITLKLPLAPGTRVEVVVIATEVDDFGDLVRAASANLEFWDNPWDDEDWNHAAPR